MTRPEFACYECRIAKVNPATSLHNPTCHQCVVRTISRMTAQQRRALFAWMSSNDGEEKAQRMQADVDKLLGITP